MVDLEVQINKKIEALNRVPLKKNVCWLCTSEVYRTTIYIISYYLTERKDKDENSTK